MNENDNVSNTYGRLWITACGLSIIENSHLLRALFQRKPSKQLYRSISAWTVSREWPLRLLVTEISLDAILRYAIPGTWLASDHRTAAAQQEAKQLRV